MSDTQQDYTHEAVRRRCVEEAISISPDAAEGHKRYKTYGREQYRYLLDEITVAAKIQAKKENLDAIEFEITLLSEAINIIYSIHSSFVEYTNTSSGVSKIPKYFWTHKNDPLRQIQKRDIPYIDRSELEGAAKLYLESPVRAQAVDRLLVDGLVAAELFAFGNETLNPYFVFASPVKQSHALWAYIKGQFWNVVLFGGIIAFTVWLKSKSVIGDTATAWAIGIIIGIFLLLLVISTISMPRIWRHQAKMRRQTSKILEDMIGVYSDLKSDGPISANHIRLRAQKAADDGVKWPAPLFALLDDIIARTGRF